MVTNLKIHKLLNQSKQNFNIRFSKRYFLRNVNNKTITEMQFETAGTKILTCCSYRIIQLKPQ